MNTHNNQKNNDGKAQRVWSRNDQVYEDDGADNDTDRRNAGMNNNRCIEDGDDEPSSLTSPPPPPHVDGNVRTPNPRYLGLVAEKYCALTMTLVYPVSLTMLLVVWSVTVLTPTASRTIFSEGAVSFTSSSSSASGQHASPTSDQLGHAVLNALIAVGIVVATTVLVVILYKYRCMAVLKAWMLGSSISILFLLTWVFADVFCQRFQIAYDWISILVFLANFGGVGVLSLFYFGNPRVMQMYLVFTSITIAWLLNRMLPEWTTWVLLLGMAVYDLFSVLCRRGPLRQLVDIADEREEHMVGFIYHGGGREGGDVEMMEAESREGGGSASSTSAGGAQGGVEQDVASTPTSSYRGVPRQQQDECQSDDRRERTNFTLCEDSSGAVGAMSYGAVGAVDPGQQISSSSSTMRTHVVTSATSSLLQLQSDAACEDNRADDNDNEVEDIRGSAAKSAISVMRHNSSRLTKQQAPSPPPFTTKSTNSAKAPTGGGNKKKQQGEGFEASGGETAMMGVQEADARHEEREAAGALTTRSTATTTTTNTTTTAAAATPPPPTADPFVALFQAVTMAEKDGFRLGLGDFIFYSVLVAKAALYSDASWISSMVAVLIGLVLTLCSVFFFRQSVPAVPALPLSILIGLLIFFVGKYFIVPIVYFQGLAFLA